MESDKIRFLLAKALGQALNLDQTKRAISGVTKEQLLKKNVLYTDQVYDQLKQQLINLLRTEMVPELTTSATLSFLKSPPGSEMISKGVIIALKLDGTIDSFVEGVVDEKIYKMLEDPEMGRGVGEYIVKLLE